MKLEEMAVLLLALGGKREEEEEDFRKGYCKLGVSSSAEWALNESTLFRKRQESSRRHHQL